MTRWITKMDALDTDAVLPTTLIQNLRRRLNHLARMGSPLDLPYRRQSCLFGSNRRKARRNRFHPIPQGRVLTMRHSAGSSLQTTSQNQIPRHFRLRSARKSSIRTKRSSLLSPDAPIVPLQSSLQMVLTEVQFDTDDATFGERLQYAPQESTK